MRTHLLKTLLCTSAAAAALAPGLAIAVTYDCDDPVQNGKVRSYRCVVSVPCSDFDTDMKLGLGDVGDDETKADGDFSEPELSSKTPSSCVVKWTFTKKTAGKANVSCWLGSSDEYESYEDSFTVTEDLLAMYVVPGQGDGDTQTAMLASHQHDLFLPAGGPVSISVRSIDVWEGMPSYYTGPVMAWIQGEGAAFADGSMKTEVFVEEGFAQLDVVGIPEGGVAQLFLGSEEIETAGITIVPTDGPVTPAGADADADGNLTALDAIHTVRKALGLPTPSGQWGDLNGDGGVNILDAALSVKVLPFAPSGLVCGDSSCDDGETSLSCPGDCEVPLMGGNGPQAPEIVPLDPYHDLAAVVPSSKDVLCVRPDQIEQALYQLQAEPLGGGGVAMVLKDAEGDPEAVMLKLQVTDTPYACSDDFEPCGGDGACDEGELCESDADCEDKEWVDPGEPMVANDRAKSWINAECLLMNPGYELSCQGNDGPWEPQAGFETVKKIDEKSCSGGATGSCTEYFVHVWTWSYYLDNQCSLPTGDTHHSDGWVCI